MTIFEDSVNCLASDQRGPFLALLAFELTMAARGGYVEAGNEPARAAAWLRCHNELVMVAAKQLRTSPGKPGVGYPDRVFMEVLTNKAKTGSCESSLRYALERTLFGVLPKPNRYQPEVVYPATGYVDAALDQQEHQRR
jgi:hypothetical protein